MEQLLDLLANGLSFDKIHSAYPFLERADISEALRYATDIARRDFYLAVPI